MRWLVALFVLLAPALASADPVVSPILYLNRCKGGCTIYGGTDDARSGLSSLPCTGGVTCGNGSCSCQGQHAGTYLIDEFEDSAGNTGDAADAEWDQIVQCVREVYSPYNVEVTDVLPPNGMSHNQGIVAGRPVNIGYGSAGIGGIAPYAPGCAPRDNVISFTFANIYGGSGISRAYAICAVAAQETAHAYGLDHAWEFLDGRSACNDPMSYRSDCGGQKFFRNEQARCGEFAPRGCRCGGTQNSHRLLLNIFGSKTPLTPPPTLTVSAPVAGETIPAATPVIATAYAQRGVARLELWLNGYKWLEVGGAEFGPGGQPESTYSLVIPADVPDSVLDIVVKAYDDIEQVTESPVVTVTKGAPCTTADTCAKGQQCEAGKCFWAEPTGELGDSCEYNQFCKSGSCVDTTAGMVCTEDCVVGVDDSCPMGFSCAGEAGNSGVCVLEGAGDDTCCGIGANGKTCALLSVLVVGFVLRRRRR
jgi:hypothetical protein